MKVEIDGEDEYRYRANPMKWYRDRVMKWVKKERGRRLEEDT